MTTEADKFLELIAPWSSAYRQATFIYVAVKGQPTKLLWGQMRLMPTTTPLATRSIETPRLVAGFRIVPVDDLRDLVTEAATGRVRLPDFEALVEVEEHSRISPYFSPYNPDSTTHPVRLPVLQITGKSRQRLIDLLSIDWELRSSVTPYSDLQDLLTDLQAPRSIGEACRLDVAALPIASIDATSSLSGSKAIIECSLVKALDPHASRLGWKAIDKDDNTERSSLAGSAMHWRDGGDYHRMRFELDVKPGALVECFLSYGGVLQHRALLVDSEMMPNPRAASYAAFDPQLAKVQYQLFDDKGRSEGSHFEEGVATLLHMLGFSALHIGDFLTEAPDILVVTPGNKVIAVECTTGLLDQNNKLSKLIRRSETLRRTLRTTGSHHFTVVPMLVTALETKDVRADFPKAHAHHVLVFCREQLLQLIKRAAIPQDPDLLVQEGYAEMDAANEQRPFWK